MAKSKQEWVPKTFVRFELDEKQLQELKKWKPTVEEFDDYLLRLIEEDYKITQNYDGYNKCFQASMQKQGSVGINAKLILTGRGSTPMKALKQLFAKHTACSGEWPTPDFSLRAGQELDD